MTTPTILPTKWQGNAQDYLKTKADRSGAARGQYTTVSVPSGTTTTTIVGLVPFNRGFRFLQGASQLATANLGASVTLNIGYVYNDNVTYTNDTDAFASLLTASAAGLLVFDETIGLGWVAEGDGWIVAEIAGATTGTTGAISGQIVGEYDDVSAIN